VAENQDEKAGTPRLRALRDFFLGAPTDSTPARNASTGDLAEPPTTPVRIGPYRILRKLGQGGMGIVYAAQDDRLDRTLAIKTIQGLADDETARKRFWREAKAAASVNHPNVCQLYEVGEEGGSLFIVMELLDGEALSDRLRAGALLVDEAVPAALAILSALGALHARGIVHRDLKPSNVFLTSHGVKLLDFGLARSVSSAVTASATSVTDLTEPGMVVGTPRYMAPEQVTGHEVTLRTDLFSLGAMLFEMLSGQPAFAGKTVVEVLYATLHEQPPALSGSAAVAATDRVIRHALAKNPRERYPTAEAMAADLRAALLAEGTGSTARASTLTRLVVLPFRSLRADPDTDFLAFSLPDAIATSLSGLPSLVVRSTAAASRFASDRLDLKAIAAEADVDRVLTGTLLRSGEQLRVATQLVEAPAGTLVCSHSAQAPLGDVFALQDDLVRRIVEALALPLGGSRAKADVPRSARAYEFYLRANEVSRAYDQLPVARDLYLRCLEEDDAFAPAWARLGRCYRVIGKYFENYLEDRPRNRQLAEAAFRRALELNPDLPIAHKLFTHLEAETGRAPEAMVRLLRLAKSLRHDPEVFAGLVHACRYCGLFEASLAAHEEARRLDPHVPTSREYTLLMSGGFDALAEAHGSLIDMDARLLGLMFQGKRDEARDLYATIDLSRAPSIYRISLAIVPPFIAGDEAAAIAAADAAAAVHDDPEALFLFGWFFAALGVRRRALEVLELAVGGGFLASPTLIHYRQFDFLRADPAFRDLVQRTERRRVLAKAAFREAGGEGLLGLSRSDA
jgi:serine/threonine protein kinase/tetratricopeptide (TPR) repeat protein